MEFRYPLRALSRKSSRSRLSRRLLLVVVFVAAFSSSLGASFRFGYGSSFSMPDEDPYEVLGIKRKDRNNMDAIKKAYRDMARKAHPDKNPNLDPEVANQNFHRINSAYEYLSDEEQKRHYDTRQRHQGRNNNNNNNSYRQQQEARRRRQQQQAKEEERRRRAEEARRQREITKLAREAQANLLKVTTLEDLFQNNIVERKTKVFRKNFLCVFVSNKRIESIAENEYLFPYPFGTDSGRNNVEWKNLVQTAKVRFNKATPLTKAFNVPTSLSRPYIIFVEEGTRFDRLKYKMYNPGRHHSYEKFEKWVMDQLRATVSVINHNPVGSPSIRPYFVISGESSLKILRSAGKPVAPGYMLEIQAKLSDRIVVLDEATNEFVGSFGATRQNSWEIDESVLDLIAMDDIIVTEKEQIINLGAGHGTTRTCYDLSLGCQTWLAHENNKCQRFSAFAHSMCAKSCGVCLESPYFNGLYYVLLHSPTYKVPGGVPSAIFLVVREIAKFGETACHDFLHLWTMRRTVLATFLVGGLLLGIQIDLLVRMMLEESPGLVRTKDQPSLLVLGFWFFSTAYVACVLLFVYQANAADLLHWRGLVSFHWDLVNMRRNMPEIAVIFLCIGIGSQAVSKVLTFPFFRRQGLNLFGRILFLVSTVVVSFLMVVGLTLHIDQEARNSSYMYRINNKWARALKLHKNVAVVLVTLGHMIGNTMLILLHYVTYKLRTRKGVHLLASLANILVGCVFASVVSNDPYFLQDLEHVTSMRMSASIPCMVVAMLLGIHVAYNLFDNTSVVSTRSKEANQNPELIKAKVD